MQLADFDFDLPPELIARYPMPQRSSSRLLTLDSATGNISHGYFYELIDHIEPGDLLVFNNTRVIPARLHGKKATGGLVELLVERILDEARILAQLRVSKPPRMGDIIYLSMDIQLEVIGRYNQFYELRYQNRERSILDVIEMIGQIPLPPYMQRVPDESDKERYQTIYAEEKGSVAAPTAGFHFDEALMDKLRAKQVETAFLTLHIGAGTFSPVRTDNIREHKMHAEFLEVSNEVCAKIMRAKSLGKRVIAVGTTSLRALETASQSGTIAPYRGETSIFIYPGYQFRCVDALVTNLHLPKSTLLMLVSAFAGHAEVMRAYRIAVQEGYRFYSYGDAMWLEVKR